MAFEPETWNEDELLRFISDGTAAEIGSKFFRALVKNLSKALGTHGAWVTEFLPETKRLRAFAFWLGEGYVEDYEYAVQGTPCEKLISNKSYLHIPENVVELFPGDPDLAKTNSVSYIGFPLLDDQRNFIGNIAVVDTSPMPDSFRNLALFRIFGARASAEILRLKTEAELRNREEKLRGVFEGTMDAIVELDSGFRITMMNAAARKLFNISDQTVIGIDFKRYLPENDFDQLTGLIRRLNQQPRTRRSLWVPGGLTVVTGQDKTIPTEATLSELDMHGSSFYVLILRDVNERYEAEKTIASLRDETYYLRDEIRSLYDHGDIIGRSRSLLSTLELVSEVSPTDSTVLLYGETGTGKELIARAIHAASSRKDRALITVNCAAIPDSLMESEFFGHEQGAFTGATQSREGRFSLADGGTIFLDEIGELNMEMQSKLLRVLQEGEFAPVGSSRNQKVDVRVIAATNRDLSQAVQQGEFRTDLYYRLNVFPITIPPLRNRSGDIGLLAEHFLEKYSARLRKQMEPLSADLIRRMEAYPWPGNVRELQNVIERGVITARYGHLNLDHALPEAAEKPSIESPPPDGVLTLKQIQRFERDNMLIALQKCKWRVAGKNGAAQLLGMPSSTLQSRMKSLGIERPR